MSESYLALAVRDRIRLHADYTGPPDFTSRINVEWDERAPATAADFYIMILPGSVEPGPLYDNGRTIDEVYGLDIAIALRAPRKPRDRQRDLWVQTTRSFAYHEKRIRDQVDFNYTTMNLANTNMITDGEATGTCDKFVEPLRFAGRDRIRPAPAEIFAGVAGEPTAALIRTVRYRGARRLITRS